MRSSVVSMVVIGVLSLVGASCGSKSATPLSPTPTPSNTQTNTPPPQTNTPPANRPPVITAATVTPGSGITTLTTYSFSASATDPDGDALTYSWDFGNGTTSNNSSASVTYTNANTTTYRVTVTVRDSGGETVSATLSARSVSITGDWQGTMGGIPISAHMTQYLGGIVDGTWEMPAIGGVGEIGPAGEPGKIQANGQFELRFKVRVGSFSDFYYRGTINADGTTLTGTLQGSGFSGQSMVLNKR
jgi:PKD domain-containing protein